MTLLSSLVTVNQYSPYLCCGPSPCSSYKREHIRSLQKKKKEKKVTDSVSLSFRRFAFLDDHLSCRAIRKRKIAFYAKDENHTNSNHNLSFQNEQVFQHATDKATITQGLNN